MKKLKKVLVVSLMAISILGVVNLCGGPGGVSPVTTEIIYQIK